MPHWMAPLIAGAGTHPTYMLAVQSPHCCTSTECPACTMTGAAKAQLHGALQQQYQSQQQTHVNKRVILHALTCVMPYFV